MWEDGLYRTRRRLSEGRVPRDHFQRFYDLHRLFSQYRYVAKHLHVDLKLYGRIILGRGSRGTHQDNFSKLYSSSYSIQLVLTRKFYRATSSSLGLVLPSA